MIIETENEIPGLNIEDLKLQGFKVHKMTMPKSGAVNRGRRDYYKMGVVTGEMTVYSGDRVLEMTGTSLFFINPNIPHRVVVHSRQTTGYACLFTEGFISGRERCDRNEPGQRKSILKSSPLFQPGDSPLVPLNKEQASFLTGVFQKMLAVHNGDYHYKGELIRSCIELIIHEALRIQPSKHELPFKNAATRITHLFMDLLEKQFPIERVGDALTLRTPQDFAVELAVHVNYLNRSVKEVTGKPTSVLIAERITSEARALLQYTDWNIADIAYALGFEYPTYFNNYFKRVTGTTPNSFRK